MGTTLKETRIGRKILCKYCKTKHFVKIEDDEHPEQDYGFIVFHKKDCEHMKKAVKYSLEL